MQEDTETSQMGKKEVLKEYRSKRDFTKTGEPSGVNAQTGKNDLFVIQKHAARSLHYDLRLEMDGVLKSWAVPKGPSTDPGDKRLALLTEDHPLEYADFEGVIPEDEYGGGTVLLWDRGTYRNLRGEKGDEGKTMTASYDEGKIEIFLEGEKLRGGYVLIRTGKGRKEQWLLKKMKDDHADARRNPISTQPWSVVSGQTIEEIEEAHKNSS
jgi:DNA ligase D-like protein (predicted 3'-phosphoesterase)